MPVARSVHGKPDWCSWSAFGTFECDDAAKFDDHFHDADEYWLIFEGRGIVRSEGVEYEVGPGDVVFTKMGENDDVVQVLEGPLRAFYIEDQLRGRQRPGHLHRGVDDQAPHTQARGCGRARTGWGSAGRVRVRRASRRPVGSHERRHATSQARQRDSSPVSPLQCPGSTKSSGREAEGPTLR